MPWVEIMQQQLFDPFRIGLIVALVATALRTETVTGMLVPLLAGVLFVAVIIPATMAPPGAAGLVPTVISGVFVNLVILAAVMGLWRVFRQFRR